MIRNKEEIDSINQEEVWDGISDSWNDNREECLEIVKEFLEGKSGKVLDFGCGNGRNMVDGFDYLGVDFSSGQLEHARKRANERGINALFVRGELDEVSVDGEFDYGLFMASLHCLDKSDKRFNALKSFYGLLKVGGEGLISVWKSDNKRFSGKKKEVYVEWENNGKKFNRFYYLYELDEFVELLKSVGFKILEIVDKEDNRFNKRNWIVRVGK